MGTRCTRDLTVRRAIDAVGYQVRREMSEAATAMADKHGEPPLNAFGRGGL